jgi:hypothetical protein
MAAVVFSVLILAAARAEDFKIPDVGTLKIVAAGEWQIGGEDMGDRFELVIVPNNEKTNAACRISINLSGPPELNSRNAVRDRVAEAIKPQLAKAVEKRVVPEQFYSRQGFGYHVTLTFADRVGKPHERGKFRMQTLGLIHLGPRLIASVTILADDPLSEEYQQLLGAVEGMEIIRRK